MRTLDGLVGKIPSNPLWAELLAAKQREKEARRTASSASFAKDRRVAESAEVGVRSRSGAGAGAGESEAQ